MALVTGTPQGNIQASEDLYIDGAPYIYFQDYNANPLFNPDSDGFYWGMSGTSTYPANNIGCPVDVSLTENLTVNDVLCDNVGVKDTVMQRNYLELTVTVRSIFPAQVLTEILKGGAVTETAPTQKFGFGPISATQYWMVYAPKVYDTSVGDYVVVHLHKAKFVNAFTMNMSFGDKWEVTGITLRGFADTTKPEVQQFGVFMRSDASVIT